MNTTDKNSYGVLTYRVQQFLSREGYSIGSTGVDGLIGENTVKAIRAFQKDVGLKPDGIVGEKTAEEIYKKLKTNGKNDSMDIELENYFSKFATFSRNKDLQHNASDAGFMENLKSSFVKVGNWMKEHWIIVLVIGVVLYVAFTESGQAQWKSLTGKDFKKITAKKSSKKTVKKKGVETSKKTAKKSKKV